MIGGFFLIMMWWLKQALQHGLGSNSVYTVWILSWSINVKNWQITNVAMYHWERQAQVWCWAASLKPKRIWFQNLYLITVKMYLAWSKLNIDKLPEQSSI